MTAVRSPGRRWGRCRRGKEQNLEPDPGLLEGGEKKRSCRWFTPGSREEITLPVPLRAAGYFLLAGSSPSGSELFLLLPSSPSPVRKDSKGNFWLTWISADRFYNSFGQQNAFPGSSARAQTRPTALRREAAGSYGAGGGTPRRRSRYPRFFPWKTEEKSGNGEKSDISKGKEKLNGKSLFLYMYFFLPSRLRFGAALGVGGGSAEPPAAFTPAGRGRAVRPPLPKSPPPSRNTLPPSPWAPALLEAGGRGAICGVGAGRSRP